MVTTTDLQHYWKLDVNSSTQVDSHGSYDGTVTGASYDASGKLGAAYDFDGVSDYIDFGSGTPVGTGAWSISAWIKPQEATLGGYREILSMDSGGSYDQVFMFTNDGGDKLVWGHRQSNRSVSVDITYSNFKDTWTHVLVTYDGGTQTDSANYNCYVDGSLYTTGKASFTVGGSNTKAILGANVSGSDNEWDGLIDEVGVWDAELTSTDASDLYNSGSGLAYPFTGTNLQLNISDAWKTVDDLQINIGDVWKTVDGAQINIGDAWKTIY